MSIRHHKAWKALESHRDTMRDVHLKTLFEQDGRFDAFSRQAAGLTLDFSKQRMRRETLDLLLDLAREAKVEDAVERLLSGKRVNLTEDRPALHTALRLPREGEFHVEGEDVQAGVHESLDRMQQMVEKLQSVAWCKRQGYQAGDQPGRGRFGSGPADDRQGAGRCLCLAACP